MKKRVILIPLGLIALALLALSLVYLARMRAETAKMSPLPSGEAAAGVFAVQDDYVNFYLMPCEGDWIAIDAGITPESVQREMDLLGISPSAVKAVFLTHSDNDHTGALPLFTAARLYISEQEEQMVNGQTKRAYLFSNRPLSKHETLADGETVEVSGCRVTGILTPGHTPGSMVYLVNDAHLFSGDTFALQNGVAVPFNEFFNLDTPRQIESIAGLAARGGFDMLFTAHYGKAPASALR